MNVKTALRELNEKPLIRIWPTCGTLLGLSRTGVYEAVQRGEIEVMNIVRLQKVISAPLREKLKIKEQHRKDAE